MTDGAELYPTENMLIKGIKDLTKEEISLTVRCKRFRNLDILAIVRSTLDVIFYHQKRL